MGKQVTLGGDRLGSGNKNKQELHNYYRSTHNLSQKFTSSMCAGALYPFLVLPAMRGDAFEIDLHGDALTIPTKGPLFGSFKLQMDVFQCPVRLYQAILHNNPTAIGLKMSQVKFPKIRLQHTAKNTETASGALNNSCLLKLLGMSGLGSYGFSTPATEHQFERKINAIPLLAYYDIFKNYYSNKQEQNAWVIAGAQQTNLYSFSWEGDASWLVDGEAILYNSNINPGGQLSINSPVVINVRIKFPKKDLTESDIESMYPITFIGENERIQPTLDDYEADYGMTYMITTSSNGKDYVLNISINAEAITALEVDTGSLNTLEFNELEYERTEPKLDLASFPLKNLDDMRLALLSHNELGNSFIIGSHEGDNWNDNSGSDNTGLPYALQFAELIQDNESYIMANQLPMNGLMVKTYQSDLYNNWINTDWIDGDNGIAAITAISTASGSFTMDALNLAEKLYNMLNRIAVSGNTYEDWQDAVYTQSPRRHIESPVFIGGASHEICFEQIVQTAPSEAGGETSELGNLGGKGKLIKGKGGHINVKVDEASFIIGIVSITPRIVYTQGNEWYLTELDSMDDFHKPALDGIGYQDLIGEELAWWDTKILSADHTITRHKIGKVPAWIHYMTAVDKAYGDFAETDGKGFMVLNRNYEMYKNGATYLIKDATTYIDPSKFNYAFAYTELAAQNFWVSIYSDIKARRLMSAKQIPNI